MIENSRILIADDERSIHNDFEKILMAPVTQDADLRALEAVLFDDGPDTDAEQSAELPTYEIDHAYSGSEALQMVEAAGTAGRPYALVFMDVRMPPGFDGVETIAGMWERYPHTETVICTAYSDYSWDAIIDKLGSTDRLLFLKKPFNTVEVKQIALALVKKWNLQQQIRDLIHNLEKEVAERTAQLHTLMEELKKQNAELEHTNRILADTAIRDGLTGLLNHAEFHNRLRTMLYSANRYHTALSVVMFDVDFFKSINDTYGHQIGDQVLCQVARVLESTIAKGGDAAPAPSPTHVRADDVTSRYGGDEFAIILSHCAAEAAQAVITRLRSFIEAIQIPEQPDLHITCSFGIASVPADAVCPDEKELIKLADTALYMIKAQGRKGIHCIEFPDCLAIV